MADLPRKGDQEVRIVDAVDQYAAKITADGRILVSNEITTPENTTPILVTAQSSISSPADTNYTIPDGKLLKIQQLQAGAQVGLNGSKVELYYDPNGNGVGMTLIGAIYVDGSSGTLDLNVEHIGNGVERIVLRRYPFGNTSREIFGQWVGYEQTV